VLPIDKSEADPIRRMLVVGDPDAVPDVQAEVLAEVERAAPHAAPMGGIERFPFYDAAKTAFAVVQVGDARPFGCFLIRKGVIRGEKQ
jgi:L-fucose mutarotase